MGYRISRFLQRLINSVISIVVAAILMLSAAYALFALWDNEHIYSSARNAQADLLHFKPTVQENQRPSFDKLLVLNPDVRAWLTMHGTHIDFPVLQGETNLVYINQNIYREFSLAGSIFMDACNAPDMTDPYNLLYGHHMDAGNMFGDLDLYKNETFFSENTTGELLLPDRIYDLEVFATLVVNVSDTTVFQPMYWKNGNFDGQLAQAKEKAMFWREAVVNEMQNCTDPQVLSLTTCSSEFTDARTVVLAWMKPRENNTGGIKS